MGIELQVSKHAGAEDGLTNEEWAFYQALQSRLHRILNSIVSDLENGPDMLSRIEKITDSADDNGKSFINIRLDSPFNYGKKYDFDTLELLHQDKYEVTITNILNHITNIVKTSGYKNHRLNGVLFYLGGEFFTFSIINKEDEYYNHTIKEVDDFLKEVFSVDRLKKNWQDAQDRNNKRKEQEAIKWKKHLNN